MLANRVQETTTTTGTGTIALNGPATGKQSFAAEIGNGNSCYYLITDGASAFEIGIGSVIVGSPNQLTRTTVLESSAADGLVNFGAGTKNVYCIAPTEALGANRGELDYGATAGAANAYTLTLRPAPKLYRNGMAVLARIHAANTGAATLAVNGLAAKAIRKGDGTTALAAGDLALNAFYWLRYDSGLDVFTIVGSSALPLDALPRSGGTLTGALNEAQAAAVASAASVDIWAIAGNEVHITGTTAISNFGTSGLPVGAERTVIFDGALTLSHNANLDLPGAAAIATAAGDRAIVRADSATKAVVIAYQKADGSAIAGAGYKFKAVTATGAETASDALSTILCNSATAITRTLPAANAVAAGAYIEYQNVNTGTVTISRAGTDNIANENAAAVASLLLQVTGDRVKLVSDGVSLWRVLSSKRRYVSTDTAITLGAANTFTHNLGLANYQSQINLVCATAENGYAAGDLVRIGDISRYTTGGAVLPVLTPTAVSVLFSATAQLTYLNKTTFADVAFTAGNWKLRIYSEVSV